MNFFRTVFALCAHFQNYRAIRDVPVTTSLKFIGRLMALLTLVLMLAAIPRARTGINEFARRLDTHRPDFALADGKIETTAQQPHVWGEPALRFILDTTGHVTALDSNAVQGVLFTSNSFVYWMTLTNGPEPVVRSHEASLAGFPNGQINGDYFRALVKTFLWVLIPFSWLVLTLVGLLVCLIQAYVFSFVASFLERNLQHGLQLPQLLNIAIHAVAPAAIIVTAYQAMWLEGVDLWLIYLIAYGIFLIGASSACRDVSRKEDSEEELL
jgi:hypothetical protein